MKINYLFCIIIFITFSNHIKASSSTSFSDTLVDRLMKTFQYKEAVDALNYKLKNTQPNEYEKQLYFNNQLSLAYFRLRSLDSAMICARKSIQLSAMAADSGLISEAWRVMSYSYNHHGQLDSAVLYTQKMLNYGERNGNKVLVRNSLTSLATIMNQNNRPEEALNYFRETGVLSKEIGDSTGYTVALYNIGYTYLHLHKPDSSLYYLNQSLERSLKEKHYDLSAWTYISISEAFLSQNNFNKWKESTVNLFNLAREMKNGEFMTHAYNRLLRGLTKQGEYKEAILYGNKAVEYLNTHPFKSLQLSVDSGMYVAYEAIGDYENALNFLKSFYSEKYMLLNEIQQEQLNEIQVKLYVKEKDLTIAEQKIELSQKQKKVQILMFLTVILILMLIGIFINKIKSSQFRKNLYKKEKYLENQVNETKQWLAGTTLRNSISQTIIGELSADAESIPVKQDILSPQSLLYAELREMVENQKLYLNPELNLQMVIKLLGTNKKYLYEAISSNTDNNFRNFVNRYRVDYAKRMIEENITQKGEMNITELFSFCGFSNPTTFFRTFKTITGLTPKEYAAEVKAEFKSEMIT